MMKKILFALLLSAFFLHGQISVSPGAKFPVVKAEWIRKPAAKPVPDGKIPVLEIVTMLDVNMRDAVQTLRLMEELERKYLYSTKGKIRFRTVARNSPEELKKMLNSFPVPFRLVIGSDKENHTFSNFSIAIVPYTFIGKDGAIAWSGHPVDIEFVLDSLLDGTFSEKTFRELLKLRNEMQSAIRSGLPDVAAAAAEKALKIAPNDTIALQTRLYAFQISGNNEGAVKFLESHLQSGAKVARERITLVLLDMIARTGDTAAWKKRVERAASELKKPEEQLALLAYLTLNAPFGDAPLTVMYSLSEELLKVFAKSPSGTAYIENLLIAARIRWMAGRPAEAVRYQEAALKQMKKENYGDPAAAERVLDFYRQVLILSGLKSR